MAIIDPIEDLYDPPQPSNEVAAEAEVRFAGWAQLLNSMDPGLFDLSQKSVQAIADALQTVTAWDSLLATAVTINYAPGIDGLAQHLGADPDGTLLTFLAPPHPGQPSQTSPISGLDDYATGFWVGFLNWLSALIQPWTLFGPQREKGDDGGT